MSPGGVDFGHCLVVLEEGAEATLLAETASSDAGRRRDCTAGPSNCSWAPGPGSAT